ncbi:DUF805 domain-containing protein [Methylorubrum sp. Q1]|uniref:DUF805 domain-containing protein n=1 Tax=Methylorubrum sp. Q1 TaxID=2562453 RepID=UPI00107671DA|nr:DUF805 domain-containing protein [Methylorubrum sp. Q1]TFZ60461.1 DUF805 domain-containing protein [Methylorubrum sp. Q1]
MRGRILKTPGAATAGIISGRDGLRYRYSASDLHWPGRSLAAGEEVDFEPQGTQAGDVLVAETSPRIRGRRFWLTFFLAPVGRISRRQYWLYGVFVLGLANLYQINSHNSVVNWFVVFVTGWAGIALAAKRLHDLDRSGWWVAAPVVPAGLAVIGARLMLQGSSGTLGPTLAIIGGAVAAGLSLWLLFSLLILTGDAGPNRFGTLPPPLPT